MHRATGSIRGGGLALVIAAVTFMGVFAYLAANFHYPEVLDGPANTVLPALLQTGSTGRLVWAVYAFLPLLWIPAGVAAFQALRPHGEGSMRLAMHFANLGALSMMLGLMRWPSIQWELALSYGMATPSQRALLDAVYLGLNRYLGNYIGEFLGELSVGLFFLFSALAMLRAGRRLRWVAMLGLLTAVAGLIGMFRNVTALVQPVADMNNYLLPLWMIVFGVVLMRWRTAGTQESLAN